MLVVEDEAELRGMFGEVLQDAGYEVAMAANGYEALRVLAALEAPAALILLDLMMPVLDGHGFLARLRANSTLPQIPVLVLTGSDVPVPPGAQALLRKPARLEALLAAVAQYVRQS